MRILLLLLVAWPAFAGPITFTFEGTWQGSTEQVPGVVIQDGGTFSGQFTFERHAQEVGAVTGEFFFVLGPLVFDRMLWFREEFGNGGTMAAMTSEPGCETQFGLVPCVALFNVRDRVFGGSDFGILGEYGHGIVGIAGTTDIRLNPYNPFTFAFEAPEPSTFTTLLGALLLLISTQVRRRQATRVAVKVGDDVGRRPVR